MVKWEDLLYKTSALEKVLLDREPLNIPEKGFTGIWEETEQLDYGYKATISYVEGGNRLGYRYTFVIIQSDISDWAVYGWSSGWRLPVPERGELKDFDEALVLAKAMAKAKREYLPPTRLLPLFVTEQEEDGKVMHRDGWYSTSLYALPRPVPPCLEGARAWSIREGIYVFFPDRSYRLIPHRKWGEWLTILDNYGMELIGRQGDLLVFTSYHLPQPEDDWEMLDEECLDRHTITSRSHEEHTYKVCFDDFQYGGYIFHRVDEREDALVFTHPEHEKVEIEIPSQGCWVVLLGGTSHPFKKEID